VYVWNEEEGNRYAKNKKACPRHATLVRIKLL